MASWTGEFQGNNQAVKTYTSPPPPERYPTPDELDGKSFRESRSCPTKKTRQPMDGAMDGVASSEGEVPTIRIRAQDHDAQVGKEDEGDNDDVREQAEIKEVKEIKEEDEVEVGLETENEEVLEMLRVDLEDGSNLPFKINEGEDNRAEKEETEEENIEEKPEEQEELEEQEKLEQEEIPEQEQMVAAHNDEDKPGEEGNVALVSEQFETPGVSNAIESKDATFDSEGSPITGRLKGDANVVGEDVPECKVDTQECGGEKHPGDNGRALEASFASGSPSSVKVQENMLHKLGDKTLVTPPQVCRY